MYHLLSNFFIYSKFLPICIQFYYEFFFKEFNQNWIFTSSNICFLVSNCFFYLRNCLFVPLNSFSPVFSILLFFHLFLIHEILMNFFHFSLPFYYFHFMASAKNTFFPNLYLKYCSSVFREYCLILHQHLIFSFLTKRNHIMFAICLNTLDL